jgi:pimeloyl-ACP methyl ester carboxylesterase
VEDGFESVRHDMPLIDIAITGSPGLLAAHLVNVQRVRSRRLGYLASVAEFARFAELVDTLTREQGADASHVELERLRGPQRLAGANVWHFLPCGRGIERSWLDAMRRAGIAALNVVESPYCGGQRWRWLLPKPPSEDAGDPRAAGVGPVRRFRTTLTVGVATHDDIAQEGVLHFLSTLFDLKTEIDERVDNFFEHRALRCSVAPDATVNILPVERAAAMIDAIVDGTEDGDFVIASSNSMTGEEFLDVVGDAYGVSLLGGYRTAPQDIAETSPDTLFDRRLMDFASHLVEPVAAAAERAWALAGIRSDKARLDRATFARLVEEVRRRQEDAHRSLAPYAVAVGSAGSAHRARHDGQDLVYTRLGGEGPVVALINALGQGLEAWTRLGHLLSRRFRVLSWELRGLDCEHPAMSVGDHVADLSAILDEEGVDRAHLVAWCTGPKIAVEFARRFPARVCSLVLLNTTMKCAATASTHDTPNVRNLESLCRFLTQQPAMAAAVIDSFTASGAQVAEGDLLGDDPNGLTSVLAVMNRDLRESVLRPFRDPSSLMRYAGQLTDFCNVDVSTAASDVRVPVLLLASEYDRVVTPEWSERAFRLFPSASLLRVPGATHYFLYDRADVVARALEWFISTERTV